MERPQGLGTILVTGGAGWLGSCIVETLLADGSFSTVASSIEPQVTSNRKIDGAIYHECDLLDTTQLTSLLDRVKPRVIMHTLGPDFFSAPEAHRRLTYDLSKQLIAIAKKHPCVQGFVYTCTVEAVALTPSHNDHAVREDEVGLYSLQHGPMAYSRTKAAIDALVREANTPQALDNTSSNFTDQLLTAVLRVPGLYGPRDKLTIMEMLKLVNTSKTAYQIGPDRLVHDWIYVDSCARAHMLAAKALLQPPTAERADGEAFFVSDGQPVRFWGFARKVWQEAGDANWAPHGPHRVIWIPFWVVLFGVGLLEWVFWVFTFGTVRPGSTAQTYSFMRTGCWLDIGKARRVLGYEPLFDTEEGIRRTIRWMRDNGYLQNKKDY